MFFNYSHPPKWLEDNIVFRYLFLLRKIYLTRKSFKHFSQFAEDISIERLFPKRHKGIFIDVGCFHPIKYNNTWKLYKSGWRGINVDIDPIKIDAFKMVRAKDFNVACAVSSKSGFVEYFSNGFYSLTTTLSEDFSKHRHNYTTKSSKCETLDSIIQRSPYSNKQIDFISIDAEGHDLEILKSLNLNKYNPSVIAIESHEKSLEKVKSTNEFKHLIANDYDLVAWCGLTLVFASTNFLKITSESKH